MAIRYLDEHEERCKFCKSDCEIDGMSGSIICHGFVAKTNADRIRAMTDEELATFLDNFGDCPCFGVKFCEHGTRCEDAVLMKLREPVDNGACSADETSEKVKEDE